MSKSGNSSNYYEQDSYPTTERATLAEELIYTSISNLTGKFFLKIMTPDLDTSDPYEKSNSHINSSSSSSNYLELVIPSYMLSSVSIEFTDTDGTTKYKIVKGTKFLVTFLGGYMEADKVNIIGVEL